MDKPIEHALTIDKKHFKKLTRLREKAVGNPISFEQMQARQLLVKMGHEMKPIGDEQAVEVPVGYRVAYSVEYYDELMPCHHLSVSGPNDQPHPEAVSFLMRLFGIRVPLLKAMVYAEQIGEWKDGNGRIVPRIAVNVVVPLSNDMRELKALIDAQRSPKVPVH